MGELVNYLIKTGELKTPRIIEAFKKVDRKNFVLDEFKDSAYLDTPLPIGHGQTISQPQVVAFMLELLRVSPGEKVLEIGAGSGWQTALLAELVGEQGKVVAIERIKELFQMAQKNLSSYQYKQIELVFSDGSRGYAKEAPYAKIIAAASSRDIPKAWQEEIMVGGRLVFPMGWSVWRLVKTKDNSFKKEEYPGFTFVPLIED